MHRLIHVIYLWRRMKQNNKHMLTNWHKQKPFSVMNKNITHYQAVTWIDKITTSRRFFYYANNPTRNSNPTITRNVRTGLSQHQCWRQGWGINTAFPHPKQVRSTYLIPRKYYARSRPKILVVLVTAWLKYTINTHTTLKANSIKQHIPYFTVIKTATLNISIWGAAIQNPSYQTSQSISY